MGLKMLRLEGSSLYGVSVPYYTPWTSTEILVWQRLYCCLGILFLLRNLASHYMPWTSKEILQKLDSCFEVFFLLEILLRTLDMVVLEKFSLGLRFSKKFLADLKMSSGLLKCFVLVWFCKFCLPNILLWVLVHFSHTSSHLILAQFFAPFYCLSFLWCNFSFKF